MDLEQCCGNCGRWIPAVKQRVSHSEMAVVDDHCPWFPNKSAESKPQSWCWKPPNRSQSNSKDIDTKDYQKSL